jgi:SAM-dependent methyltransferase
MLRWISCLAAILTLCLAAAPLAAQDMHRHTGHHPRFEDPEKWAKSFDNPDRDMWQMPDRLVASLALKPTDSIADIGAGTGYMAVRLARAVPDGQVFAVDVEPDMVRYTAMRASSENLGNLRGVIGEAASPRLPEPVDVVFLLNTYHHIDGRPDYFKRLHASLKPGARVAIVDFRPDASAGAPKHMRFSVAQITDEMKAAGYRLAEAFDFLPRQNFLIFRTAD